MWQLFGKNTDLEVCYFDKGFTRIIVILTTPVQKLGGSPFRQKNIFPYDFNFEKFRQRAVLRCTHYILLSF